MATTVLPVIPSQITVHLGKPDSPAPNVQVSFSDYIKNVASSEIYPTWPESSLRANIYSQISFALNRIYTGWYRNKGYDFDITNSTQYDQAYVDGRNIFENISQIVDEIFNNYVTKGEGIEPYFTQFCNGTTVTCDGLSQWGTVPLAEKGYTPYEILKYYYGDDINIKRNAPVEDVEESYPGVPLKLGMSGNDVKLIQNQLNRIGKNYPAIPKITMPDSVFGKETEAAVKKFQSIFGLVPDGIVGKSTWYKINEIYVGVKQLSELTSEGIKYSEVAPVSPTEMKKGVTGYAVQVVQYYLAVIAYFNTAIPLIEVDGYFGDETENAVRQFQYQYGLPITGEVNAQTWDKMREVYGGIISSLSPGYEGEKAEIYPGYILKKGLEDQNVQDLQTYLAFISKSYPQIPAPAITGYYGDQTYNSVLAFQNYFGLEPWGFVGPVTWSKIAQIYNQLKGF
ncbi:MAG: peptidoglycan-binding protein [Oscillospiraceae bacterium]